MMFKMNEKSLKKYDEWSKKHDKECPYLRVGSAGGRTTFSFTPTGLGTQIVVQCACGKSIDVTDITEW